VPDTVVGQLGSRLQHAMRAYTAREQKAIRSAAQTFRSNPRLDTEQAFSQMGVGEALVSTLQARGVPGMVDRTLIRPPTSRIGPISMEERAEVRSRSPVGNRYDRALDRESAAEVLQARAAKLARQKKKSESAQRSRPARRKSSRQSPTEAAVKSFLRSISSTLGREIMRGILGAIKKG
jgi:hypothetical protein